MEAVEEQQLNEAMAELSGGATASRAEREAARRGSGRGRGRHTLPRRGDHGGSRSAAPSSATERRAQRTETNTVAAAIAAVATPVAGSFDMDVESASDEDNEPSPPRLRGSMSLLLQQRSRELVSLARSRALSARQRADATFGVLHLLIASALIVLSVGLAGCSLSHGCSADPVGLPGGPLFSLLAVLSSSRVGAATVDAAGRGVPGLCGSLLACCALVNIDGALDTSDELFRLVAGVAKAAALSTIMLRAGLGLDFGVLRSNPRFVATLAAVPCFAEACTVAVASRWALPFLSSGWSLLLGFLLADVSPAVTTPLLLDLQARLTHWLTGTHCELLLDLQTRARLALAPHPSPIPTQYANLGPIQPQPCLTTCLTCRRAGWAPSAAYRASCSPRQTSTRSRRSGVVFPTPCASSAELVRSG